MKVRREKLAALQEEGKNPFEITKCDVSHHSQEIKDHYEELKGSSVAVAGRLIYRLSVLRYLQNFILDHSRRSFYLHLLSYFRTSIRG